MNEWKVVKSFSDKHPEYGYPLGEILCKSLEEAVEYIGSCDFKDCYIEDFTEKED